MPKYFHAKLFLLECENGTWMILGGKSQLMKSETARFHGHGCSDKMRSCKGLAPYLNLSKTLAAFTDSYKVDHRGNFLI